jgi:glucose-1-phosphate thymidylyltransferase
MKCIILAGGFATRLWPLTENKAKPLLHLKDRPLISHIADGLPQDIEIIISTNAVFEDEFKKWAFDYPKRAIKIFVEDSTEDKCKKGALGATSLVIEKMGINEDLLLIAGDNYFGFQMADFINFFKGNPLLAAFDIKDKNAARKFGVVVSSGGHVTEFQEKPNEPKSTLVSTGCYIFPAKNLGDIVTYAKLKNDDLGGIFEYLLKKGETIDVFSFKEKWFDVGSFEGYLNANRDLLDNRLIEKKNVTKVGSNKFNGGVYLGDNVTVTNSIIHDSVVLNGCKIDNCVIKNCVVDENCELTNIDLSHKMIRQCSNIKK